MKHGFLKVAAFTPHLRVADVAHNTSVILAEGREAEKRGARVLVFPELALTGATCGDLFYQETLVRAAGKALKRILTQTQATASDALWVVGLPLEKDGKLYNTAAVIQNGRLLAFIPKTHLSATGPMGEARFFTQGNQVPDTVSFAGTEVPFGTRILIDLEDSMRGLKLACEIGTDLNAPDAPSTLHTLNGATLIAHLSAQPTLVESDAYVRDLIRMTSARQVCAYISAAAGEGESTTDAVFSGHSVIAECGTILAERTPFKNGTLYTEVDVKKLRHERRRLSFYSAPEEMRYGYLRIPVQMERVDTELTRHFPASPFVPVEDAARRTRCEEILTMQAQGLKKRMEHIGCKTALIGISGGLDSTLALLVTARAYDLMGLDRKGILGVTMPCFGTTDRTYTNACAMVEAIGATLKTVRIDASVRLHFTDIGHDENVHDVTYENAQARERTQVLMDLANELNGLVVGTGDLSELALGWATFNGDHMAMYGVNAGVPKTMLKYLVRHYADTCGDDALQKTLYDVLDTPVSPELLPPEGGVIAQKTEELVGPYELHDYFLYYMLRYGFAPDKIYRIACRTFDGRYPAEEIKKWLQTFYRRFFSQQFKRSCLPDGVGIGSVGISPRGTLQMPSDAVAELWMKSI